ncbi:MAG: YihY/virulence factor BrkB family protein [Sedimentibacter sp.]
MFKKSFVFLIKLMAKMKDDNIVALSAQFSYYIILGIFPFLILAISLLCNFSYYIFYLLDSIEGILPADVFNIVSTVVQNSVNSCSKPYYSASILVILWSATAGSATIINGINRAYGFTVRNNYLFMRIEGIIFALAIMLIMLLIFAAIVLGNEIVSFLQHIALFTDFTYIIIGIFRYALPFLLMFLIFSAAYKFLTYEKVSFSFVIPGALASTIGFIIGSMIYSNYISTKAKFYNSIYGNLSGLIIFLIWIFILSIIFLTGAEINHFIGKGSQKKKNGK